MSIFKGEEGALARVKGTGRGMLTFSEGSGMLILTATCASGPDIQVEHVLSPTAAERVSHFGAGLRQLSLSGIMDTGCKGSTSIDFSKFASRAAKTGLQATVTFAGTTYKGVVTDVQIMNGTAAGLMPKMVVAQITMLGVPV